MGIESVKVSFDFSKFYEFSRKNYANPSIWDDEKFDKFLDMSVDTCKAHNNERHHEQIYIELYFQLYSTVGLHTYLQAISKPDGIELYFFKQLNKRMEKESWNKLPPFVDNRGNKGIWPLDIQTNRPCFFMSSTKGVRK